MLPPGIIEAKARRMAKAKWRELGPELCQFWRHYWGDEYVKKSLASKRYGKP